VKLSAPPPPPPPPDEPEPGPPTPPESTPASPEPPAGTPTTVPEKPLAWPSWFAGADLLLAGLALVLAFLLASFVARNSDLWVHLAAGQRLLAGEYRPGNDPFSYTAADRAWVNHSLLYDVGAYLLFRIDLTGMVLVLVKALAVAVTFGLLIAIRRPGFPLWPWAVVAVVAAVAAGPRLALTPLVGSMLFLAATLFLLFRLPHRPNSLGFPVAVGVAFWLWAMVDQWFFVGPVALALVLVGEWIQRGFESPAAAPEGHEPLGSPPDVPTLAKALAVGIIACTLTPHHFRVWDLPFELVGAEGIEADLRVRQFAYSPFSADFSKDDPRGRSLGYNHTGLAYVTLFIGGGVLLGLGAGRLRFAHLALWVGFALLSFGSIYAIPLFSVIAVPIVASQLNAVSTGVALKSWGDPRSRFVLLGSAAGRVLSVVATALICVLAWPGWMHPDYGDPAFARRVAWGVYQDAAMVGAASQIQAWRQDGRLPDDARGMIASTELANYCAWFAPREKVFINGRLNHHRRELPEYIAVRRALSIIQRDEPPDPRRLEEDFRKYDIRYVAVHAGPGEGTQRAGVLETSLLMWQDAEQWSTWYLNGRTVISGFRSRPGAEGPSFEALRLNPVALAFGKDAERAPPGEVRPIPPVMGWEQEFVRGVNLAPAGADEAIGWWQYGQVRRAMIEHRQRAVQPLLLAADHVTGRSGALYVPAMSAAAPAVAAEHRGDELDAAALLAWRAARRAIATDPDHPDGYFALSLVLQESRLPFGDEERTIGRITALRQYLSRVPPPERYKAGASLGSPYLAWVELAHLYLGAQRGSSQFPGMPVSLPAFRPLLMYSPLFIVQGGREIRRLTLAEQHAQNARVFPGQYLLPIDLARDALLQAERYLAADAPNEEEARRRGEQFRELLKPVEAQYRAATNDLEQRKFAAGGRMTVQDQVAWALRSNLVGEALRILTDPGTDLQKEFGKGTLDTAMLMVALQLAAGRLEDAAGNLEVIPPEVDALASRPELARELGVERLFEQQRTQSFLKLLLEGDYAGAGAMFERSAPPDLGKDPPIPPDSPGEPEMKDPEKLARNSRVMQFVPMASMLVVSLLDTFHREALINAVLNRFASVQQALRNRRMRDMEYYTRRGELFLLEGNVAEARRRFEAAFQPGVPRWGVSDFHHAEAERYLRLIRRAEGR
jgi:hypothetical protein